MDIATAVGLISSFTMLLMSIGGSLPVFIDIPSALLVVGGTVSLALISFPLEEFCFLVSHIRYVFYMPRALDRDKAMREMEKAVFMLGRIRTLALATGAVGVLIGVVIILANVNDPKQIGPGAALAILTALYGLVLAYWLCWPLQTKLRCALTS